MVSKVSAVEVVRTSKELLERVAEDKKATHARYIKLVKREKELVAQVESLMSDTEIVKLYDEQIKVENEWK